MRVIICGAGRVGYGLAARLAAENNTVTVVDLSPDLIRQITTDLDVRGIVGHGSQANIMIFTAARICLSILSFRLR